MRSMGSMPSPPWSSSRGAASLESTSSTPSPSSASSLPASAAAADSFELERPPGPSALSHLGPSFWMNTEPTGAVSRMLSTAVVRIASPRESLSMICAGTDASAACTVALGTWAAQE